MLLKIVENLAVALLLAGVAGMVGAVILTASRVSVIEARNEFIEKQTSEIVNLAKGIGELNQSANTFLIRTQYYDKRFADIEAEQDDLRNRLERMR